MRDQATLHRIQALVIPPAWKDVWICPIATGHLQATGRDARGRKQSRYHARWRQTRDETKFDRMLAFGTSLPALRQRIEKDLAMKDLSRERVLATIVRLLETTYIRVGNEEYARENHSYGLTTMRNKHVKVRGATVTFNFRGKSGVQRTVRLTDRRLARVIRRCQDIPGYELFQYVDDEGTRHSIDSGDVNEYLREISDMDITAKDFRTWAGTLLACMILRQFESHDSEKTAKANVVTAIRDVAKRLGNTPAVCRKCYVHPAIVKYYLNGKFGSPIRERHYRSANAAKAIQKEENALIHLLKRVA